MAKILLATLGNPKYVSDKDKYGREDIKEDIYKKSEYSYCGQNFEAVYAFDALNAIVKADKLLLFGTVGSNWAMLYHSLFFYEGTSSLPADGAEYDNDYYIRLCKFKDSSDKSNPDMAEALNMLEPLRRSMSNCDRIILLNQGLNDAEWRQNLAILQDIQQSFEDVNDLYIDITYGFRTLPIYEFLSILNYQNIYNGIINIRGLVYAQNAYEYHVPFVDLDPMIDLLKYTRVINEYDRYGTVHSFDMKTAYHDDLTALGRDAQTVLEQFSDAISFNDISRFKRIVKQCKSIVEQSSNENAPIEIRLLSDHIFRDISDRFSGYLSDDYRLQYELALWHFERKRYLVAITTAEECTISLAGDISGLPFSQYEDRRNISYKLSYIGRANDSESTKHIKKDFNSIRSLRNNLAHPTGAEEQNNNSLRQQIGSSLKTIRDHYVNFFSKTRNHDKYRDELKHSLNND